MVDSVVGLVRWLVEVEVVDEPCVLGFVSDGLGDVAVGDSPGSWVEVDPVDVPWFDVPGPLLASEPEPLLGEPVPPLGEEELLEPSEPVPSA
ncbi:MAG TPA: hypothetical protein VF477_19500 [Mycobacterium sp.]